MYCIPICRPYMRGENHVVECLDRPYNFWYVVKTFGPTNNDFIKAIKYCNELRKQLIYHEDRKNT